MGRPLNKKYFGNRNIGSTSVTTDNGIGGSAAGTVSFGGANNSTGFTAGTSQVALSAPTIPGGVTATATLVVGPAGALLTMAAGTSGNNRTTISSPTGTAVATTATYTSVPAKSSNGPGTGATFIVVRTGGTNYNANTVVTANGKGTGYVSGNTVTISGADLGGADGTNDLTITLGGSVAAAGTITAINIVESGSGYVAAPTFTFSVGTIGTAGPVVAFAPDTGAVGSATNEENAIIAYAYHTGGSLLIGDIVRQVSTDRYKVKNATTTAIAKLKATIANGAGEMNIVATDTDGKTYYVIKLTSRKATLVPAAVTRLSTSAGTIFAPDTAGVYKMVPWKFDAAATGYVQIENA